MASEQKHHEDRGIPHSHLVQSIKMAADADIDLHLGKIEELFTYGAVKAVEPSKLADSTYSRAVRSCIIIRLFEQLAQEDPSTGETVLSTLQEYMNCILGRILIDTLSKQKGGL